MSLVSSVKRIAKTASPRLVNQLARLREATSEFRESWKRWDHEDRAQQVPFSHTTTLGLNPDASPWSLEDLPLPLKNHIKNMNKIHDRFATKTNVWQQQYDKFATGKDYNRLFRDITSGIYLSCEAPLYKKEENRPNPLLAFDREYKELLRITKPFLDMHKDRRDHEGFEYLRAYMLFKNMNIVKEYEGFCSDHQLFPNWALARNYYYARNVIGLMALHGQNKRSTVLEIGGGSGAMAVILGLMGVVRDYIIVDLPEMLAFSAFSVHKFLPGARICFGTPEQSIFPNASTYSFLCPEEASKIRDSSLDMSVNFISFAEMDRASRDYYFDQIYRVTRPGGIHYNVNRTHQLLEQSDGTPFYNHSLLYPYRENDRVIFWGIDPLQLVSRMWFAKQPINPAYARAALINCLSDTCHPVNLLPVTAFHAVPLGKLLSDLGARPRDVSVERKGEQPE